MCTPLAEHVLDPAEEARLARILGGGGLPPGETPSTAFDLLDKKCGVLDVQGSLRAFFHPRSQPGVHFESYLSMRAPAKGLASTTSSHVWLRRWFILEGSKLFFVRESASDPGTPCEDAPERSLVCDVVLSSVREVGPSAGAGGGGGVGGPGAAVG